MQLSDEHINQLCTALEATFNRAELNLFTGQREDTLDLKFEDFLEGTFQQRLFIYVSALNRISKAIVLFDECWENRTGFQQNETAKILKANFSDLFVKTAGGEIVLKREYFERNLLEKDKLPFIGREEVKDLCFDLVHGSVSRFLLINGELGSGRSYIRNYLREIALLTQSFKLVTIDLKRIYKRVKSHINMYHIARAIKLAISEFEVPFDLSIEEQYKNTVFEEEFYEFLQQTSTRYLFFFDHFDNEHSQSVRDFVDILVSDIFEQVIPNHFVVLSGYKNITEWEYELQMAAESLKIQSFSREEVETFLKGLHQYFVQQHTLNINENDFLDLLSEEPFLDDALFSDQAAAKLNVTKIGREITDWLESFKEQYL